MNQDDAVKDLKKRMEKIDANRTKDDVVQDIAEYLPQLQKDFLVSLLELLRNIPLEDDDWDRQIAADAQAGRLDHLADKAIAEHKAGNSTDLFEGLKEAQAKLEQNA